MARGGSVEFHYCRILCLSCVSLHLGCKILFSSVLTLDCGTQFASSIWTGVCCALGISPSTTTSFHPQSNGMLEKFHRSLKTALYTCLAGSDWFLHLPLVLLDLWSAPKEDMGFSISDAVFGSPLTVPGELMDSFCSLSSYRRLIRLSPDLPLLHLIMCLWLSPLLFRQPC